MALKTLAMLPIAWAFGASKAAARDTAIMLGPGGEFAFVLIGAASASGVIDAHAGRIGIVAAALSMLLLPVIGRFVAVGAARRRRDATPAEALIEPPADELSRVIIVGYGRVGALIGEMLDVHKIPFIGVDNDARLVAQARGEGRPTYYGDATRAEFLRVCGIETARALVVTMNSPEANEEVVEVARKLRPEMTIVARARDAEHASMLYKLGVTDAVPETIEASLQMSEAVLVDIGVPMGYVIASIHEKRDEYRKRLVEAGAPDRVLQARRKPKPK
jgi:CPA2 family monovalent cation:H+ antiporter-2